MLKLYNDRRFLIFFDTNTDAGSGGSASQSGQQTGAGQSASPPDPFKDLPWDELDDVTKAQLEKVRTSHVATLQRQTQLETDLKRSDGIARRFQSELDRLKAEVEKTTKPPPKDEYLEGVKDQLRRSGFNADEVEKMAPVFAGMFKSLVPQFKKEIGADLQPLATTVLGREAESAFTNARLNDPLKKLEDPEVAEYVWAMVTDRVKEGQQTNIGIVQNLARIAWTEKQERLKMNPDAANQPSNPTPPALRTGLSYPGANNAPTFTQPAPANSPRTKLNDDTEAALRTTFGYLGRATGVYPKRFQPTAKKGRK